MYQNIKIAAVIPARKGSKGIPNKNIRPLAGVPLVEYTIREASKSQWIDQVIVSTDAEEVIRIAKDYHIEVKGLRPAELASDQAILYDVIRYEIEQYQLKEKGFSVIVLLQPTSPLRKCEMIDKALKTFIDQGQASAVSVSEVLEHPIFMRTIDNQGQLKPLLDVDGTIRRQDLPPFFRVNGMIYINRIEDILRGYVSFNDNLFPILIPKSYDIDIDEISDLEEAERRIKWLSDGVKDV